MLISNYQAWLQGSNRLREGGSGHPGPTPVALLLCFACENKSPQIDLNLRPRIKHKAQNDWLHNSSTSGQYLVEAPFGSSCRLGSVWTGPSQFTCLDASALSVKLRHPARTASLKTSQRFWIWLRSDFATSGQLLSCFETISVCVFFSFSEVLLNTRSYDFSECLFQSTDLFLKKLPIASRWDVSPQHDAATFTLWWRWCFCWPDFLRK